MRANIKILLTSIILLLIIGLTVVFSASGTYSQYRFNSYYYMFNSHLFRVIIALFALIFFTFFKVKYLKLYSKKIILTLAVLLIFTLMVSKVKGAGRWISFYAFTIQPSELAKIALIIHLSNLIEKKDVLIEDFKKGYIYLAIWVFLIAGLVIMQPNVSTSLIITITGFTLIYVGGAKLKHVLSTLLIGGSISGSIMMIFSHSRERIMTYINSIINNTDINIQVKQAKIGLGSGGLLGVGIGNSGQSDLFLPESYGDFIFSILGEEFGFLGALLVITVYLTIFIISLNIAKKSATKFEQLVVFGLGLNIVLNAFINIAVVTGLIPTTGITLPLISYGGTSLIVVCSSIGIILNIARKNMSGKVKLGYSI